METLLCVPVSEPRHRDQAQNSFATLVRAPHCIEPLTLGPVFLARLYYQSLVPGGQLDSTEFRECHRSIGHISQTILVAQFLLQNLEYLVDALFPAYFEITATAFAGEPL